ncbi:MAG: ribose 5-phosphate isomerase B [Chloroflexi bacterium RBG_13_51_36]|nr:MAG: ribose 5-phosphate isomerase B [Chloroflexi bacterium RBG_13_51_36]
MKRIAIGCDHRGITLKKAIVPLLQNTGYTCQDFGSYSTDPVDYPDIAQKVGEAIASGGFDQGILICDTGIGMSIAANKIKGIRAALCCNAFSAQRARQHNDANILCLRADDIDTESALEITRTFLATDFEGGRHIRRVNKIRALEGHSTE